MKSQYTSLGITLILAFPFLVSAATFTSPLNVGSSGSEVSALQEFLANKGYLSASPTGYYGPFTQAAVMKFQSANGIQPLGSVGPSTRAALNTASSDAEVLGAETSPALATSPATVNCSLNATPSNFAAQVSAAAEGQVICLATGDYGTWAGTSKAITITKQSGAAPQMQINFGTGDSGFTLDGMSGMGGSISGSASNITVRNSQFTGEVRVTGTGAGIVFDGNSHNYIGGNTTSARFLAAGPVTIRNSHFEGGGSDGVRLATEAKVNVLNNVFLNILDDGSGNHTDMIQWYGGSNAVVRGNLFKQTIGGDTQVMGAFDGTGGNLIEDNVVDVTGRNWGVELYSDDGSIVRHNTFVHRPAGACSYNLPCGIISITRKSADDAGRNTQVHDNIATEISVSNGSEVSRSDGNMLRQGAGSGDFVGTPAFVGGANPTTYAGYALAAGSAGKGGASDGLDVGIRAVSGGTPAIPSDSTPPASAKFSTGSRVQVVGGPLNVRVSATTAASLLGSQTNGSLGTVEGGPVAQGGYVWWNVNYDAGVDGWSVENYLAAYAAPAAPTAPTAPVAPTDPAAPVAPTTTVADDENPSKPAGLEAVAVSASQIVLTWSPASDNVGVTGYEVLRDGKQVGTTAVTAYTDTGLSASRTYRYQVRAVDAADNHSYKSATARETTLKSGSTLEVPMASATPTAPTAPAAPAPSVPTASVSGATHSIWDTSATPKVANEADTSAVELGTKFTTNSAGKVTGMRFYKGSKNTGTHTGSLWSASGTRLATGTFTNESASGWQTLTFSSPVSIAANTTYVVSYHASVGAYAVDEDYFKVERTSGPITALRNAGVYKYGTGGFPTQTYKSTNYWVDALFTPNN